MSFTPPGVVQPQGWDQEQLKRKIISPVLEDLVRQNSCQGGRNGKPSRYCGKSKDKALPREAGWPEALLAQTPRNKSLSLPPLPDTPRLFLFQSFSFALLPTILLEAASTLTTANSRVGLEESQSDELYWYKSCPKCRIFNTKTPKSVQTLIVPNAAGSNTQSCQISYCMISDRKVLNAHLQVVALLSHAEWPGGFFHSCVKDEHRERHFSPL